ncbi:MOSC domain-containing protein [Rhodococcus ruber]|mgnify:CR=1 FL=1|uniref:MOSC domain-containing protein n=1 Tax=Rhodococcus TaxID=1827 RepID=UPI00029A8E2A|nr:MULTISPECIES: MOSC domain-containing protein [Rhodococcus]MDO2378819.1 MOSC domain-containing protein [Rhodococcus ruber]ATQ30919.1 MOSC domain-containing protein [Rhodococcus ruber]AUM16523.1 MOSC domain-containing protein [Rhodococcus ruber]MBD8052243.1 MOSC domain-containing protein [Rhodococcus ruber]MCF8784204.1 MOSC domain-containing protein [Rhodococcus ruber]
MSHRNPPTGRVEAVCTVHSVRASGTRRVAHTAIDKRPVTGPVQVRRLGLAGDRQCDTAHHGGRHKAVYAYAEDEARRWADELGRELPAGWFGENLRVSGIAASDAVIGERWRIGALGLLLEVTGPRTPCGTFGVWAQEPGWVRRFAARGDTGAYLKVLAEGPVEAGDGIFVVHVPEHGVTVRDLFTGRDPARIAEMLAQQDDLSPSVADKARRRVAGREVQVEY